MAGWVAAAFLAAVGLLSLLWALAGWMLRLCRRGILVYRGVPGEWGFSGIYVWLRSLGLVRCTLVVVDLNLEENSRVWMKEQGIEICTAEELPERLKLGETLL